MKARIRQWGGRHPRLWAARHVVKAVLKIALGLLLARLALGLVLDLGWGWLPDWRPPRILPRIPDLPWPDVELPDWTLPGWLAAVLETKKYWFPVLVGVAVAAAEVRRRRRQENAAWPGPSTPRSTPPGDSSSSTPDSPASPPTGTTARRPR